MSTLPEKKQYRKLKILYFLSVLAVYVSMVLGMILVYALINSAVGLHPYVSLAAGIVILIAARRLTLLLFQKTDFEERFLPEK